MILTACANMCTAVESIVGPQVAEWIFIAIAAAAGWWKLRKVQATAQAGLVAAQEQASKAKAEAREARLSLAELKGSLRPVVSSIAPTLPPVRDTSAEEGSTSASGTYTPVQWPEIPSDVKLPPPPPIPAPSTPVPPIRRKDKP